MKTNQLMQVKIGSHILPIEHKTMMGSLTDVWRIGNAYRLQRGNKELDLNNFLRSYETLEFIEALEEKLGVENSRPPKCVTTTHLEVIDSNGVSGAVPTIKSELIRTKRGKGGGTWAHLYILLDAAARLDAHFRLEMYQTFVESKILQWRDDSGDQFIGLNAAIDAYLPGRSGKDNQGIYINVAKMLKAKIAPDGDNWNTASYLQLKRRADLETALINLLQLGVVRDWEHLKELIGKV